MYQYQVNEKPEKQFHRYSQCLHPEILKGQVQPVQNKETVREKNNSNKHENEGQIKLIMSTLQPLSMYLFCFCKKVKIKHTGSKTIQISTCIRDRMEGETIFCHHTLYICLAVKHPQFA